MTTTGIIVEYNPLHYGHIYHLNKTKQLTNCDSIIAVMSGNFVQRGEPAIINKWARTKAALLSGVDLVIELPVIYSISSAEGFAFGAVSILNSLGIIDNLCFGSEIGNIDKLYYISKILYEEPEEYKYILKKYIKSGLSFPSARQQSLYKYIIDKNDVNVNINDIENIIKNPNNILSIEYIKSLIKLRSNIKPYTIERIINSYNDENLTGMISSATSIRKNIYNEEIKNALPEYSYEIIKNEEKNGRAPITIDDFSNILLYKLRSEEINYISSIADVSEGLEYKIKRASEDSVSINELIENIKSKRYTSARIKRILLYSLLGITKEIYDKKKKQPAEYVRILGFNSRGKELIKSIKEKSSIPLITNPSQKDTNILELDIKATDFYVLGYKNKIYTSAKQDLKVPPVII
ncbi:Predicted nucleotidyltransferase [Caloramator quimbayensis]|uniref:tRNA(Met) cytidine acetate ligase n=1 Tax=Caloramator quimbayensis TaxID=1147123 RepID=A0A1T4XRV2_9CLOT|nr:nucleotidyltransferase [Caloramator quimbayensis]SKA92290.1 Predicted nucleotidyltransferase [Caloramator quimbayensis]